MTADVDMAAAPEGAADAQRPALAPFIVQAAARTARLGATVFVVLLLAFLLLRLSGTPIDAMFPEGIDPETEARLRAEWGLDRPLHHQFLGYLGEIAQGNFGRSLVSGRRVIDIYAAVIGPTLWLGGLALLVSVLVSVPLGAWCAQRAGSGADNALGAGFFVLYAMPNFVLAIGLIWVFGYWLRVLPTIGASTPWHYVLPVGLLALTSVASLARYVRGAILDESGKDYIRTALAKGMTRRQAFARHALPNALIPVVTVIGMDVQGIVTGSVIVEMVFAWPGVGREFIGAVRNSDYPVFQFGVLFYAGIVVGVNYVTDMIYMALDPRVRVDA